MALLFLWTASAAPVPRGQPATLEIVNATAAPLECHAVAGHWYGFDLGIFAAASHHGVAMLYDRASGMAEMVNARDQPIPLQFVYCGHPANAWRSRAVLPLREALRHPAPVVCRLTAAALRCGVD